MELTWSGFEQINCKKTFLWTRKSDYRLDNSEHQEISVYFVRMAACVYVMCFFSDANWCMRDTTEKCEMYLMEGKDKANVAIVDNGWIWTMDIWGSLCYPIFVCVWNSVKKFFNKNILLYIHLFSSHLFHTQYTLC